jgi:endonuclease/exonuclease/phosphatase family metal-dependent hydrolase
MIIGDFNSDNHRKNKFDRILIDMIKRKNIEILDDQLYRSLKKEDRYTYEGGNGGRSWIDHIICNKQMKEEVLSIEMDEGMINTSDHKALVAEIRYQSTNKDTNKTKHKKIKI